MANKKKNLYYLNELSDYKVESDDPDVRGWKVKDSDSRVIGTVDNLLVNKEKEKVVYLDIEVDKSIIDANHDPYTKSSSAGAHEFINKEGENHLIIPVGHVRLNEDDNYVYTDKINHRTFAETKRKKKGAEIDRDYEVVVLESYNRDHSSGTSEKREQTGERRDITGNSERNPQTGNPKYSTGTSGRTTETGERKDAAGISGRTSQTDNQREATATPSTKKDLDTGREDRERRITQDKNLNQRRTSEGRTSDDETFYDQEDFDRSNYRHRR